MLKIWKRRLSQDSGFTLIELVAAMTVFSLAAGAVLSVLVAGIRTAGFSRDRTLGKDLARQRLEEMRRLPFYQPSGSFPGRPVDLLDFYFPHVTTGCPNLGAGWTGGYDSASKKFSCSTASLPNFPRFGTTVVTEFVSTVTGTMITVSPDATYSWSSPGNDLPPTRFLKAVITTNWKVGGTNQSFEIESLLGESVLENILTQGSVSGNLFSAQTAFTDTSTLSIEGIPLATSIIRGNSLKATNDASAGTLRFIAGLSAQARLPVAGARFTAIAPPNATQGLAVTTDPQSLDTGADFGVIASFGRTKAELGEAKFDPTDPTALARGKISIEDTGADDTVFLSSKNQVDNPGAYLDKNKQYLRLIKRQGSKFEASPECSESSSPTKRVTCKSGNGQIGEILIAPVDLGALGLGAPPADAGASSSAGYLFRIRYTHIGVTATARAALDSSTPVSETRAVGTLRWWSFNGTSWVQSTVCLNVNVSCGATPSTLPDPAATCIVQIIAACLIRMDSYLATWSIPPVPAPSISADGTVVSATLNGILAITTQPTNPTILQSGYLVTIGQIKAQAVDKR